MEYGEIYLFNPLNTESNKVIFVARERLKAHIELLEGVKSRKTHQHRENHRSLAKKMCARVKN